MLDELDVNGKCHCGQIDVEAVMKKSELRACHCTDCQQMRGAPPRVIAIAPTNKITVFGRPKEYIKIADSGNKRIQAFCGNCGTHLFATDLEKSFFNLRAGFLKQRFDLEPKQHVFTKSSMPWIKVKKN